MTDIDWTKVECLIRLSIQGVSHRYTNACEIAWKADPERYRELHARVKNEEMKKVNPLL